LQFVFFLFFFLFFFPFFLVFQKPDSEKLSSYECGFNPYGDARVKFDVHFYLVAILFIIFDLEIAFLFPFVVILGKLNFFGILSLFFFVFVLMLGFCYE